MLSQKGQAFEVYKLLISTILALMIMFFISGIYVYFEEQKAIISVRSLESAVKNAVSSPNEEVITVENLTFREGAAYSKRSFGYVAAIPETCISFPQAYSVSAIEVSENRISIRRQVMLTVYVKCRLEECDGDNETGDDVACEISFGEKLENE